MESSIGKRIASLRKQKDWTQEELAEKLGVSAQAVSKWENDIACPDILLLKPLAQLFGVTVDDLLGNKAQPDVVMLSPENKKELDELTLRVHVDTASGDRVRVNLPMPLVKLGLGIGLQLPEVANNDALKNIDLNAILRLVESGVLGKLVEVETADGDKVNIVVE